MPLFTPVSAISQHIISVELNLFFAYFIGLTNPISQTTYKQASEKIKKLAKYSHFALLRLMLVTTALPISTNSFVTYLTTDMGPDSFELPFPIMW